MEETNEENVIKQAEKLSKPEADVLTPGQMLKQARKERNLTRADISEQLNLSTTIIEQLEQDQYQEVRQRPVFIYGYLRNYAKLVEFSPDTIHTMINMLSQSDLVDATPPQAKSLYKPKHEFKPFVLVRNWLCYIAAIAMCASIIWFMTSRRHPEPKQTSLAPPSQLTVENSPKTVHTIKPAHHVVIHPTINYKPSEVPNQKVSDRADLYEQND